ncbi:hypothetical protein TB2_033762 [Malus domestica]
MTDKQEETEIKVKMEMKNTGDLLVGVDLATTPVPSKGDCPGGGGEREIRKGVLPGETVGSAPTTRATNFGGAIRIRWSTRLPVLDLGFGFLLFSSTIT